MTPPLPVQAAGASSIGTVPDLALAVLAAFALVVACLAQSVEQGVSRLSAAAVEDLAEQGRARAGVLAGLVAHRRRTLLVLRSARTLWQVVFAVSVTLILVDKGIAWWAVALIAVASVSALQFLFVSLVPSQWAARRPEGIALAGAPTTARLVRLSRLVDPLLGRVRASRPAPEPTEAQARAELVSDLREIVDEVGEPESIEEEDREMVRSVLDLGQTLVREVMVPRTDMVTADADLGARKALRLFVRSGFSRLPVVGDDVDDVRGVLYFKDVVARLEAHGPDLDLTAEQMMRPAEFTVEMKPADDLLRQMQAEHSHMAIVVDEYGGVAGLVTLEDIIEEVVGEVTDEHDRHVIEPEALGGGQWRVPARYPISELGDLLGVEVEDEDVDSVGGLLAKAIGRVPLPGARGELAGVRMRAEEARGRRRQVGTIVCSTVGGSGAPGAPPQAGTRKED